MTTANTVDPHLATVDDGIAITHALARFFATCNGVVGHEANYQVMLAMELEQEFPGRVRRESRVPSAGRGGIDVAVVDSEGRPWAVFEVKGGAYNVRSALKDEFRTSMPKDIASLAKVEVAPSRRWLVAVDAVGEFGRTLSQEKQQRLENDARGSSVSFAYYGHGDKTCLIAAVHAPTRHPGIQGFAGAGQHVDACDLFSIVGLTQVLSPARESLKREADAVATLYRQLLTLGYSPRQVATETYFGFAPKENKHTRKFNTKLQSYDPFGLAKNKKEMYERPDLCLFEPEVRGHFNLYPQGDTSRTYDALKYATWRVMAEFKGGATLQHCRDTTLEKKYRADIEKLGKWRKIVGRQKYDRDPQLPLIDFVFIGVDLRTHPLDPGLCNQLSSDAPQGVRFVYVHLPEAPRGTIDAA